MPRGRRKAVDVAVIEKAEAPETLTTGVTVSEVLVQAPEPVKEAPKAPILTGEAAAIADSRKVLDIPLDSSQEFYESPEGYIVIGEKGRGRVWCRAANSAKGMWINPRRA